MVLKFQTPVSLTKMSRHFFMLCLWNFRISQELKTITVHHECPYRIGNSYLRGCNFNQRWSLLSPKTQTPKKCGPQEWDCPILHWPAYRKNSKIWDTSNNCHNCPKNRKVWCNIALMHRKDTYGMANSVDPDQTVSSEAVWSWSGLFAETYLSQYIEFVRVW